MQQYHLIHTHADDTLCSTHVVTYVRMYMCVDVRAQENLWNNTYTVMYALAYAILSTGILLWAHSPHHGNQTSLIAYR